MPSVLVVDDAAYMRRKIAKDLSGSEFKIIGEASNGTEAVDAYRRLRPDIVLMDIVMPGKDGVEAASVIMGVNSSAKVVLLSSLENEIVAMKAIESGAKNFINKPYEKEYLLKVLREI